VLEFTGGAGIVRMSVDMKLGVATTCRVLELFWSWSHAANVLGCGRAIEASPLVCGESKSVDRLYVGKKVGKVVTLVAIEDGRGRRRVAHRGGGNSGVQVLRVKGTHR